MTRNRTFYSHSAADKQLKDRILQILTREIINAGSFCSNTITCHKIAVKMYTKITPYTTLSFCMFLMLLYTSKVGNKVSLWPVVILGQIRI